MTLTPEQLALSREAFAAWASDIYSCPPSEVPAISYYAFRAGAAWSAAQAGRWMPIETAPKDGSTFLAWVLPDSTFEPARVERGEPMLCCWKKDYFKTTRGNLPVFWQLIAPPPQPSSGEDGE